MNNKKLRVAVIGCGNIANTHAAAYAAHAERIELVACCDINEERGKAFAERYGIPAFYKDMYEMVAEVKPDAVSVCTWNSQHHDAAICALRGGAHVWCEKPMAMNVAEALEMKAVADEMGTLLMVGFVRRFGDDANCLAPAIAKGELGDIYYAKAQYLRCKGHPDGWFGDKSYSGGGPLIDLGVHVIDLVRYVTGLPLPTSAYGMTCSVLPANRRAWGGGWKSHSADDADFKNDIEDNATAIITFDNGTKLLIEASYNLDMLEDINRIELYGTKKAATFSPNLGYCSWSDDGQRVLEEPEGDTVADFDKMFAAEAGHFVDCCLEGAACRAPAEDGIELMRILDACYESARTGEVVKIR